MCSHLGLLWSDCGSKNYHKFEREKWTANTKGYAEKTVQTILNAGKLSIQTQHFNFNAVLIEHLIYVCLIHKDMVSKHI